MPRRTACVAVFGLNSTIRFIELNPKKKVAHVSWIDFVPTPWNRNLFGSVTIIAKSKSSCFTLFRTYHRVIGGTTCIIHQICLLYVWLIMYSLWVEQRRPNESTLTDSQNPEQAIRDSSFALVWTESIIHLHTACFNACCVTGAVFDSIKFSFVIYLVIIFAVCRGHNWI